MSWYSKDHRAVSVIVDAIRFAYPDARAKRLSRELGISIRHAKRLTVGDVSTRLRRRLLEILDAAIAQNELRLRQLRAELRALDETPLADRAPHPEDGAGKNSEAAP